MKETNNMTTVYTENVECPVCGASTAHSDVDIYTNERDFNCVRCGFYSATESVERAGKKFWKLTMEMPVSKDGRVAWPELVPNNPDNNWNRKDYGVMPSYEAVPEVFGAEEVSADGQPAVQVTEVIGEEFEL
jgi:rRNA maturation protein Nop10